MSNTKNVLKLPDKCRVDTHANDGHEMDDGGDVITCNGTESCTYSVTVSKKLSPTDEDGLCSTQKSFISIHSTDHLCQVANAENLSNIDECNLEVLSLNEVFPSTSDESISNGDESPVQRKKKKNKNKSQKGKTDSSSKSTPITSDGKTSTPQGQRESMEGQPSGFSDFDIPKSTMFVVGSNPGEPKMSYPDPPKKMSKTMKKFLRNIDKHKSEQTGKSGEKAVSKLTTVRGILKDGRCGPECTGDSERAPDDLDTPEDYTLPYSLDFGPQNYAKQIPDKNVSFNTQVVIIHFTGDLCVGQSIETLSKEKDQQARNSELRKTFLTKYNELPGNK